MIELIRNSAVPANVMRSAARGALSLPPEEIVEILVYLSGHHLFAEQAKLSLAGFDKEVMKKIAADPATAPDVVNYLADPENLRPDLVAAVIANPSLAESKLLELAMSHSHEALAAMAASPRVQKSPTVLRVLADNAELGAELRGRVQALLDSLQPHGTAHSEDDVLGIDEDVARYVSEHAAEIRAEEAKGFELTDLTDDEKHEIQQQKSEEERKRMSPLQKIAGLTVGDRVQLAMKGNREERYILIRDGCKVVSSAVLECPKLTDQEVETFAAMKNVQETVLRGIAGKRKFMKLYPVIRALASNPRCPLDVSLPMMKSLLVQDLRSLSMNKNVSDTLRKLAFKMFKEKTASKKD